MTGTTIITMVELLSGVDLTDDQWITFINAGLDDLSVVAKHLKSATVALTAGSGTLPTDCIEAKHVIKTTGSAKYRQISLQDTYSEGWKIIGSTITLQEASPLTGNITLSYYARYTQISAAANTPELPPEYHELLVLYCASRAQQQEEELEDKKDFYGDYLRGKRAFALNRMWQIEPENRPLIYDELIKLNAGGGGNA